MIIILIFREAPMQENESVEVRETLSSASTTRLDIGEDGVLHLLVGPVTIHLDQPTCEELTTTLATGLLKLVKRKKTVDLPDLRLVVSDTDGLTDQAQRGHNNE